uniref:Uncharacterized protein n=1 Tax=Geospiza parvula TaxID=87175 RepID=A0A8C3MDE0_GEOPR
MEYDEDDDIFFAKWMSSFWGHNLIDEEKEGRGHKKRQPQLWSERRASLPLPNYVLQCCSGCSAQPGRHQNILHLHT